MKRRVFFDHGVEILDDGGRLFVRWDAGHIADKIVEAEITADEAKRLMTSDEEADRVILEIEPRAYRVP